MSVKPLIAHVLYRLDTGGMERMLVTVINGTHQHYRHAVICLDEFGALRHQIESTEVQCLALHKQPGKDWGCYSRLWRALRDLKPDLVHTLNLGALDAAPIARLAGVRRVVHGERGRDASDPRGEIRKYRHMRRWLLPFIDRYLAVSGDLQRWLIDAVGIPPTRVACIPNGIDLTVFNPDAQAHSVRPLLGSFAPPGTLLIGTVGRLDAVKDQVGLITAFVKVCERLPSMRDQLRLVLVGDGPERTALESHIAGSGLPSQVCLLGKRGDVAKLLPEFDVFVLSSIAEGMPGSVLEAMASGLPVVSTRVGGVGEVVVDGATGTLVAPSNPVALADALRRYVDDEALRLQHGCAGRDRVEKHFSLPVMLSAYSALYDGLLAGYPSRARRARELVGLAGRAER